MRSQLVLWTLILIFAASLTALAAKTPPKEVVLKSCQAKKPPVKLSHEAHAKKLKVACKTCHHKGEADKPCSAAGCHAGKAEGKRPGCAEMDLKKNPFHITCIGCHKKEAKGPKVCAQCHKK